MGRAHVQWARHANAPKYKGVLGRVPGMLRRDWRVYAQTRTHSHTTMGAAIGGVWGAGWARARGSAARTQAAVGECWLKCKTPNVQKTLGIYLPSLQLHSHDNHVATTLLYYP